MTRYIEWDGIDEETFENKLDNLLIQDEQIKNINQRMSELRGMLKEKEEDIEDHAEFVGRLQENKSKLQTAKEKVISKNNENEG